MSRLEQIIIEKIKKEGPITFETFMDMALYYPELGYYSSAETTIGRAGDFYTSPHLHPVFGAVLGKQLMEMWTVLGKPSVFHSVEIGAGSGYLCKDILDYLHNPLKNISSAQDKNDFLRSLRYMIVEPYTHFEERQRDLLGDSAKNVVWIKSLKKLNDKNVIPAKAGIQRIKAPSIRLSTTDLKKKKTKDWIPGQARNDVPGICTEGVTGCIFSNELLDAFPVHLVVMEDELKEIHVDFNGKEFVEVKKGLSSAELTNYLREFSVALQSGYRTEINLRIKSWLEETGAVLSQGFLLTIDYGYSAREYYSPERTDGSLLCYHNHQFNENPYRNTGGQDITAHVNFSSLKEWGNELGLRTIGYCQQGTFLIASGIDEIITELYADSPDYAFEVSKIKGLIFPQGFGESHNVMVQYKGPGSPELRGFSMRNQVFL